MCIHLSGNNEPSFELYVKDTIQDIRCLKSRLLKMTSLLAERIWCGNELNAWCKNYSIHFHKFNTQNCRLTYHRPAQEVLCYMRLCFPQAYDTVYVWMYVWDGTTPDNLLTRSYLYTVIIMWCHHPVFSNLTLLHLLNKEIIDKIQYCWMGKCKPDVQGITINWNVSGLSLPESFSISINS